MKSKVDKLNVNKLVPVPVDLSKLSDAVKINVVKKDVYNAKIRNIEVEKPDIINLVTNTTLNATMVVIIFSDFLLFCQIFLSPQVKSSVTVSNKHGIYKLP